jgi:uncharacterized protein
MYIHHDSILTLALPYRERTALRRTVFHGGDGPKVAALAGVHGDELEGLYVCHRLAAWIEERPRRNQRHSWVRSRSSRL